MLILHASLFDQRLFVWGESSDASATPKGRKKAVKDVAPSPHDAGAPALLDALKDTGAATGGLPKKGEPMVLWAPTVGGGPVASSPLIAAPPLPGAKAELRPWRVTALPLGPAAAVQLLADCAGRGMLRPGVKVGTSLAFWATALRFAGALVAREQFLPGVQDGPAPRACWRPVLIGPDGDRKSQLAAAMPAACRALSDNGGAPPDRAAAELLGQFLDAAVDALVRGGRAEARRGRPPKFDTAHEEWLHALRSAQGEFTAAGQDRQSLAGQVEDWQRPITVATSAPFRLCFRLEEPADTDGPAEGGDIRAGGTWHLRYLLQARDDPSLLVPVEDAWKTRGPRASLFKKAGFQPGEYLLTALGQAAKVYPKLDESLKTAKPSGQALDPRGAHEFLTQRAIPLEQAGFGVLFPAWWSRKGTKQKVTAQAVVKSSSSSVGSGITLDSMIHFDWQLALGDHTLTLQELQTLARLKSPLVQVRGQWVELNEHEIQAALDFWQRQGGGDMTLRELLRTALGAGKSLHGIELKGVKADGWVADFLAQLEGQRELELLDAPAGFRGELRPYQVRGYSWLHFLQQWGLGACLADDMGLGKTVQTLALVLRDWQARPKKDRRPVLLVCPMSVVGNWQKESAKFTPELPVLVHHGQKRTKGAAFAKEAGQHALVLTSYSLLHRDVSLFEKVGWQGVILDEAQNIKNPDTKQAKAARLLRADYKVALTGTPVENHVGDLWSIMEFLNPGFLGSKTAFREHFVLPIQAHSDQAAAGRLQQLTGPFVLRRLKTDKNIISDLPDKQEMKVYCNLTREQTSLYAAVVAEAEKALADEDEGVRRKGVILGTLSRLKQVCNHPAQFLGDNSAIPGRSGKLARLTEMLEEVLDVGDRALIFSQFTEMGDIIQKHLEETFGREVLFLHGGVGKKERDRMVARFQGEEAGPGERPPLFLLSLKAGGTGLNLTAANHVFHFDRWWNPAVENQATDRAFRIGQTRNVQVHKYVCVGTVEERIDDMIERKQQIAGQVVGAGEDWLTELSNEELKDLFALRKEALGE